MAQLRLRTPEGLHVVHASRESALRDAAAIALDAARERTSAGRFLAFQGGRAYFKASPLRGRARVRHALRAHLLRRREIGRASCRERV